MTKSNTRFLVWSQLFLSPPPPPRMVAHLPSRAPSLSEALLHSACCGWVIVCWSVGRWVTVSDVADGSSVRSHRLHSLDHHHHSAAAESTRGIVLLSLPLPHPQASHFFSFLRNFSLTRNHWLHFFWNLVQFACGSNLYHWVCSPVLCFGIWHHFSSHL